MDLQRNTGQKKPIRVFGPFQSEEHKKAAEARARALMNNTKSPKTPKTANSK